MPPQDVEQARWFTDVVHPHDASLKSYLRGAFPSVRDVDDIVQESYARIWRARCAHPIQFARAFLFKVARHIALDRVRRNQASPVEAVGDLRVLCVLEEKPNAADALNYQEKVDLLSDAIAALPEGRRQIVILRKLKRLSQKEVAGQLGVSERTVENQLFRGIKQCREYLDRRGVTNLCGNDE